MKSLRCVLSVVLMSLSTVAFAQTDPQKSDAQKPSVAPVLSEAQKSFATMKSLAGEWEGPVTVPEMPDMSNGKPVHVTMRVTSRETRSCTNCRKQERRWTRPSTTIRSPCFTWTETSLLWFTIATRGTGRA